MGNYTAFGQAEQIVVGLYDLGKLDVQALDIIGHAFANVGLNSGSSCGVVARDGFSMDQIILTLLDPEWLADWQRRNPQEEQVEEYDNWWNEYWEKVSSLTAQRWRW